MKVVHVQCRHLVPEAIIHDRTPEFPGHGCMDDLITERSFDSQAMWVIDVLGLFFDM